jgi:hypothetical protein
VTAAGAGYADRSIGWPLRQRNADSLQFRGLHVPGNDRGNARPLIRIRMARLFWIAPRVAARAGAAGGGAAWPCWRDAGWLLRGDLPGVHAAAVVRGIAPRVPARAGAAGGGAAWPCWRDAGWLLRGDLPGVHAAAVVRGIAPRVPARAGAAGGGAAWPCWRDAGWLLRGDLPGVHAAAVLRRQAIVRRQAVLRRAAPPVSLAIGTARLRCASYLAIQQISLEGRATGPEMSLRGSGSPRRTGHACATQARLRP